MKKLKQMRNRFRRKPTLDKVIIILGIFLAYFIISNQIIFICFGSIPDALVTGVLGASGLEVLLTAWITTVKVKHKSKDEDEEK